MAEVNWSVTDKENLKSVISFFYESKDLAISDLKKVYEKFDYVPKVSVSGFNEDGYLIKEWSERVGRIRKKEKTVKYPEKGIRIEEYEDENKSGYLLSIKIVSSKNNLDVEKLAIAKTLKSVIKSELTGKSDEEQKPTSSHPTTVT